jgi:hypothetical protein
MHQRDGLAHFRNENAGATETPASKQSETKGTDDYFFFAAFFLAAGFFAAFFFAAMMYLLL